jgi:hypothetical protein
MAATTATASAATSDRSAQIGQAGMTGQPGTSDRSALIGLTALIGQLGMTGRAAMTATAGPPTTSPKAMATSMNRPG